MISFSFLPPSRRDVLIYDEKTLTNHKVDKFLFKKKNIEILNTRNEKINLFILLKALIFKKFNNLRDNYKYFFINTVKPKIVFTTTFPNFSFYLLKEIYPKAKYISCQMGLTKKDFYDFAYSQIKKFNYNYYADALTVLGEEDKERIKKIINCKKILVCGNLNNNEITLKKQKNKKYIVYIASTFFWELKKNKFIFNCLINFANKNNYKLYYLEKPQKKNVENLNEKKLKKIFFTKNWTFLNIKDKFEKYTFLNNSSLIAFDHSTLGYEFLSRGKKCIIFDHGKFHKLADYPKNGPFWCESKFHFKIEKKIKKILNYNNDEWKKIYKHHSKQILFYDKKNKIIKNLLQKLK